MNRISLMMVFAVMLGIAGSLGAQTPTREQMLAEMLKGSDRFWKSIEKSIPPRLGCRSLFDQALVLCEARQHPERLERLFDLAAQMQDRDPASRSYGNFRWYWNNEKVFDYNAVDFNMQGGGLIWLKHKVFLPQGAQAKLKELLELGTQGCLRHRVPESYTNIAMMNAQDLIILGEALGNKKAADEGYARLDRQCLYIWECGIHEYDSPTYYGVDLDALGIIEAYAQRERGKAQAKALLELMWSDIGANFYWPAMKLAGTRSRDYDYLRGLGVLDHHLWLAGWLPSGAMKSASIYALETKWRPGEAIRSMSQKQLPRLVRQSWGEAESQFKTHYVLPDVTLGSSGACYHNMDIPLSADLPGERTGVRCYFIADGRHDPYGKVKIPEGQPGGHEKTLHLRPFFQAAQRQTDAAAMVVYREKDVAAETKTLESHWVMPLAADEFWAGGQRVPITGKEKVSIPVKIGQAVVLKRGTAAVGLRVMLARGCDGKEAPVSLEFDGNTYGAVRVTVEHGNVDKETRGQGDKERGERSEKREAGSEKEGKVDSFSRDPKGSATGVRPGLLAQHSALPPAAVLWVRVGSGLADEAKFASWRKAFETAPGRVEASEREIDVNVEGEQGKVRVQANAPYANSGAFDPPPAKVILEINGTDVGRKILENVEPIKSYLMGQGSLAPIAIDAKKGTYFEAESGAVVPGFEIGEDPAASGKKFVWIPGEPGGRGGGTGNVTWRLKMPEAGNCYIWGRVLSPTPEDDSFNLQATAAGRDVLPVTAWPLGVHKQWTWVRFNPSAGKEIGPVSCPAGDVKLILKPREDGTKLDRVFITGQKEQKPE